MGTLWKHLERMKSYYFAISDIKNYTRYKRLRAKGGQVRMVLMKVILLTKAPQIRYENKLPICWMCYIIYISNCLQKPAAWWNKYVCMCVAIVCIVTIDRYCYWKGKCEKSYKIQAMLLWFPPLYDKSQVGVHKQLILIWNVRANY